MRESVKVYLKQIVKTSILAFAMAWVLAGCDRSIPAENQGRVMGEVSYYERIALPDDAILIVQLEDVSETDAPMPVLTEQRIPLNGQQVPVAFELVYDRRKLQEERRYAVAARIEDSSGLRFITTELYGVSLAEPEVKIAVIVDPAASTAEMAEGGPAFLCSGNEPFWNLQLAGRELNLKQLRDGVDETQYTGGYTALFGPDGGAFYEWAGASGNSKLKVRILPGHCDDSMAGAEEGGLFDYSVRITVDKESLTGCCRMPDPFTENPAENYVCENDIELTATYEVLGNTSQVQLLLSDDREYILTHDISASGARYSESDTVFWNKGDEALLELDGAEAVRCELQTEN